MKPVPLNDLKRSYSRHATELEDRVIEVMRSGWWVGGKQNQLFCEMFANSLGVKQCISVGNGTDALELAIRALLECDQRFCNRASEIVNSVPEIITVANAGGYTTTACHLTGCVPVYVDIERVSQLISLQPAVASITDKTLAVVATHLYGGMVDVPKLRNMMDAAGYSKVPILEDCAQAHGLKYSELSAGTLGDVGIFSFYPTKNLGALGDGGAIVTSNDGLADCARCLQQYGWGEKYKVDSALGRNSRMDELQAAMLTVLLPYVNEDNAHRRFVLDSYKSAAPVGVQLIESSKGTVAHLAVVLTEERDRLRQHLTSKGVSTDIHYPVLDSEQKGWQKTPKVIGPGGLDVSQDSVKKILTIPCFPTLTVEEIERVCGALATYVP